MNKTNDDNESVTQTIMRLYKRNNNLGVYLPISEIDGIKIADISIKFSDHFNNITYNINIRLEDSFLGNNCIRYFSHIHKENNKEGTIESCISEALNKIFDIRYCKISDSFIFSDDTESFEHIMQELKINFYNFSQSKDNKFIKLDFDDCILCYEPCQTKAKCCKKHICRGCSYKIENRKCPNCRASMDDEDDDDEMNDE